MEDKLRLNTKLYGFDGIIGRRDYFLNIIIIASIALLFTIPYEIWLFGHIQTFSDFLNLHKMFVQAPIFLKFWFLAGNFGTLVLFLSNVCRRLNDINGEVKRYINGSVAFLFFLFSLGAMLPLTITCLFGFVSIVLRLILLFKAGKITSKYPYDFTKEFNWGAFIGTWIWGLFNKSYKTLWMLLIGFTPWGLYYSIYCGLKGNEWAFKNKKCNDVEMFNKSQEKQGIIYAILFFVGIPLLYFITVCVITFGIMFSVMDDAKNHPEKAEQTMTKLDNFMNEMVSSSFESHLITTDENKYYVKLSDWKSYSFSEKRNLLDMAATHASSIRDKEYKKQYPKGYKYFSKIEELPRTKIYSNETKRLLGEYSLKENSSDKGTVKEILTMMDAYKFYND